MKFQRDDSTQQQLLGNVDVFAYPEIRGWVALQRGDDVLGDRTVHLEADGAVIGETAADEARPDVGAALSTADRVGFHFNLAGEDLSQFKGATLRIKDVESGQYLPDDTLVLPSHHDCRILIDVGDTLIFFTHHATPSGIQRVVTEILNSAIGRPDLKSELVACDPHGSGVHPVDGRAWQAVMAALDHQPDEVQQRAERALLSAMQTRPLEPRTGDVLVLLGAPWASEAYLQSAVRFRQLGGRVVFLLYDLIPVRLPHMWNHDDQLPRRFARVLLTMALIADEMLAISDFTRRDFESYCSEYGLEAPPTSVTRLASSFRQAAPAQGSPAKNLIDVSIRGEYVLLVSTIEGRKGHALALRAWARLIREIGYERVPSLIFVGRPGWHAQDVFFELMRTGNLQGKVQVMSGVDDRMLRQLYANATFTVFPSTYEGWGLPVGESLTLGTPVIASDSTSIPEVGGDFVTYFRSGDEQGFYAAVRAWVEFDEELNKTRKRIRGEFSPDTWEDVASTIVGTAQRVAKKSRLSPYSVSVPVGSEVLFGAGTDAANSPSDLVEASWAQETRLTPIMRSMPHFTSVPIGDLILHAGTYPPEEAGRWSMGEETIQLRFNVAPADDLAVYLSVSSDDPEQPVHATIHGDCLTQSLWVVGETLVKVLVRPNSDHDVSLNIDVKRRNVLGDGRGELGVFLRSMLALRADDFSGQLRVLETHAGLKGHPIPR